MWILSCRYEVQHHFGDCFVNMFGYCFLVSKLSPSFWFEEELPHALGGRLDIDIDIDIDIDMYIYIYTAIYIYIYTYVLLYLYIYIYMLILILILAPRRNAARWAPGREGGETASAGLKRGDVTPFIMCTYTYVYYIYIYIYICIYM